MTPVYGCLLLAAAAAAYFWAWKPSSSQTGITYDELVDLRREALAEGVPYRGIYIYIRYAQIIDAMARRGIVFGNGGCAESTPWTILAIGCGYGIFDRLLPVERIRSFTGLDTADREIAHCNGWMETQPRAKRDRFRYLRLRAQELETPTPKADVVLLSEVIEHIPQRELPSLWACVDRVLSPGGYVVVTAPNRLSLRNRARMLVGKQPFIMDPTHLVRDDRSPPSAEYSLAELRSELSRGLPRYSVEEMSGAVVYCPLERWAARILHPFSTTRLTLARRLPTIASHFISVLRKPDS